MEKPFPPSAQEHSSGQAGAAHRPLNEACNGSMVQNAEDLKRLGHDMEEIPTNTELKKLGWISDPIQEE
ncbi:hypothetical protein [Paenibacillus pinihumi]|uniref:hypothetical protein n=1 Tax=Paenibacillus pinihumi TaxID=669462 RepID=UPI00048EAB09|nr:hypothetical protein [Paenibacillus pinihumi]